MLSSVYVNVDKLSSEMMRLVIIAVSVFIALTCCCNAAGIPNLRTCKILDMTHLLERNVTTLPFKDYEQNSYRRDIMKKGKDLLLVH